MGVTLVEVMLALTLAVVLTASLTRIYVVMHGGMMRQLKLEAQQYAAQRVRNILNDEIHMAGYIGCVKPVNGDPVWLLDVNTKESPDFLIASEEGLRVRYQQFPGSTLAHNMKSRQLVVTDIGIKYKAGQLLIISNCRRAEIFEVASVTIKSGLQYITSTKPLHHFYKRYAEVGEYVDRRYFIGQSRRDPNKTMRFSLYRVDTDGRAKELVSGINRLSVTRDKCGVKYSFQINDAPYGEWHGYAANEVMSTLC